MKKAFYLFLWLFILLCSKAGAHSTATERLHQFIENLHSFAEIYPQEKVYLHFDNTGYFCGETIWFKAYTIT